jgi:hAT family C-terminal dimerisation region
MCIFSHKLFFSNIEDKWRNFWNEVNGRFYEINSELLLCVACLNPKDSFWAFDKEKLVSFYPKEFSNIGLLALPNQLENFICVVRATNKFSNLNGISELARVMVQTNKHRAHPQVFLLLKLTLILPVATVSVEGVFSAMNFIKDNFRNKMCDQWMNDYLITYVEKEYLRE